MSMARAPVNGYLLYSSQVSRPRINMKVSCPAALISKPPAQPMIAGWESKKRKEQKEKERKTVKVPKY